MQGNRQMSLFEKYAYRGSSRFTSVEQPVHDQEVEEHVEADTESEKEDINYDIMEDTPYIHRYIPSESLSPLRITRGYTGRLELGWKRKVDIKQSGLMVRYISEETDGTKCWIISTTMIPFVYIWYAKDGWFLLRQVMDVFLKPNMCRKRYLRKCRIGHKDQRDGCSIISLTTSPFTSIWIELENAGVTTPWCICCDKVPHSTNRRCRTIHLINLQATRMFVMRMDAPCRSVFPLLEAIITLTRDNSRKRALTDADKQRVLMAQRCLCAECYEPILDSEGYDVHHKFRISDGGTNADINLVALHPSCHRRYTEKERNRPFTRFRYTPINQL